MTARRYPPSLGEALARAETGVDVQETETVTVTIPVQTINCANHREHYMVRARRARAERDATQVAFFGRDLTAFASGCVVRMTRVSPGRMSDEGLASAMKHIRDAIAVLVFGGRPGERDDDPRVEWVYRKMKGDPGSHGVIVSVSRRV